VKLPVKLLGNEGEDVIAPRARDSIEPRAKIAVVLKELPSGSIGRSPRTSVALASRAKYPRSSMWMKVQSAGGHIQVLIGRLCEQRFTNQVLANFSYRSAREGFAKLNAFRNFVRGEICLAVRANAIDGQI
jgi:hypothetical protein